MALRTVDDKAQWVREKFRRKVTLAIAIAAWYAIVIIGFMATFRQTEVVWGAEVPAWTLFGIFMLLYTILSFRTVDAQELATIKLFGKPMWQVGSGLVFVPFLICSLQVDPRIQIQLEIGSPVTDKEGKVLSPNQNVGAGVYVNEEPMRITFATPGSADYTLTKKPDGNPETSEDYDSSDPLHQRMTSDPHLSLFWCVDDHIVFIERVGTVEAANDLMRRAAKSALSEIAGRLTPAMAIRHLATVNQHISDKIEIRVGEREDPQDAESMKLNEEAEQVARYWWLGIDFLNCQVGSWGLPRRVNEGQADARKAGFTAEATKTTADAERYKRQQEGLGAARAQQALLVAQAAGQRALAKATAQEQGQLVMLLQTLSNALGKTNTNLVFGPDILNAMGQVTALAKQINLRPNTGGTGGAPTQT